MRWRGTGRACLRVIAVWAAGSATLAVLAAVLPDLSLESPHGEGPTEVVWAAAASAGAFGLLNALVWPLLVRALLLVPALRARPAGLLPRRVAAARRAAA